MKSSILLFAVAVASCMVIKSVAQSCDSSTCPPGPVVVHFEYSNCTGERYYESALEMADKPCELNGDSYRFAFYDETTIWTYSQINNADCDLTLPNVTWTSTSNTFGVCNRAVEARRDVDYSHFTGVVRDVYVSVAAKMFLISVNETFESPQEPPAPGNPTHLPSLNPLLSPFLCDSQDDCKNDQGVPASVIRTGYSEYGNCSTPGPAIGYGFQTGLCYSVNTDLYASVQCLGEHSFEIILYADDACTRRASSTGTRNVCEASNSQINDICIPSISPGSPPPAAPESPTVPSPSPMTPASMAPASFPIRPLSIFLATMIALSAFY